MKKLLLSLLVVISFSAANAQQDSALQKYTGKYKFPDGSPVTEINFTVENGVLMGSSAMGSSEFKKTDTEHVFEIVAYGGTATFKKNGDGKITSVQILVGDVNMEGTKAESVAGLQYQPWAAIRK
jgi:mannitol-specific phosphotransferase system IIBC component